MPYTMVLLFSSSVKLATMSAFFCLVIAEATYNKNHKDLSNKKMGKQPLTCREMLIAAVQGQTAAGIGVAAMHSLQHSRVPIATMQLL